MSRFWLALLITLSFPLFSSGRSEAHHGAAGVQVTYVDTAYMLIQRGRGPIFVDLRSSEEFARGRLPKARSLPVSELPHRFHEIPKQGHVILYCACPGQELERVYTFLAAHGYQNITVMPGGFTEWAKRGYPVER